MDDFDELLTELCIAAGIDHVDYVLATGLLQLCGMPALLQYAPESDQVLLHIDLGELPEDQQFALHVLMLESNFSADRDGHPLYGLNPANGHGIAIAHFDLVGIDNGEQLLEAALQTAERVKYGWFSQLAVSDVLFDEESELDADSDIPNAAKPTFIAASA
jgi:hypothetical protein